MTIRKLNGQGIQLGHAAMFELRSQRPPLALLDGAEAEARRLNCESPQLGSGVQRFGARRRHLQAGMNITAHPFAKSLR